MSGYVALARSVRGTPRLARSGAVGDWLADRFVEPASGPAAPLGPSIVEADPDAATESGGLDGRWAAFRDRWSQLTFFLFDPNSWR
jgi:hypothetical protein